MFTFSRDRNVGFFQGECEGDRDGDRSGEGERCGRVGEEEDVAATLEWVDEPDEKVDDGTTFECFEEGEGDESW